MMNVAQNFHGANVVVTLLIMKEIELINRLFTSCLKT